MRRFLCYARPWTIYNIISCGDRCAQDWLNKSMTPMASSQAREAAQLALAREQSYGKAISLFFIVRVVEPLGWPCVFTDRWLISA